MPEKQMSAAQPLVFLWHLSYDTILTTVKYIKTSATLSCKFL
jgi:hypothetical protein